jgi:2-dehydro-3-deoxygluconokinase
MAEPKAARVVSVGEVMVEFSRREGKISLGCGGDTFTTAIYLARAGIEVAFATALGDDPYSDAILALAGTEGVSCNLVRRVPNRLPGIYIIEHDPNGRRRFYHWRGDSPARELFELPDWGIVGEALTKAKLVYFSGITLSLYSNDGIGRFLAIVEVARQQGALIVFDGNFRPRDWKGDLPRTRAVFMEALKRVDIALPTYDDEAVLWGDPSPEATVERLQAFGIGEIVVKNGPNSALVAAGGTCDFIPVPEIVDPVDTMAAGDGFNAGYIAARLAGDRPNAAAASAHRLAGEVIRHRGSITPRAAAAMH